MQLLDYTSTRGEQKVGLVGFRPFRPNRTRTELGNKTEPNRTKIFRLGLVDFFYCYKLCHKAVGSRGQEPPHGRRKVKLRKSKKQKKRAAGI